MGPGPGFFNQFLIRANLDYGEHAESKSYNVNIAIKARCPRIMDDE